MTDNSAAATAIQAAVQQAPALRNLARGRLSPEFVAWHNQVTDLLKAAFGEDSPQYQKWVRQSYQPPHLAATPSEFKVYYVRGLDGAIRHLNSIIAELGA